MRTSVALLRELMEHENMSEEAIVAHTLQYPVLLNQEEWVPIVAWLKSLDPADSERGRAIMLVIADRQGLYRNFAQYPFGAGPVEALLQRHESGEITFSTACALAKDGRIYQFFSPLYVLMLARYAELHAQQDHKNWQRYVRLLSIVFAALDGMPEEERSASDLYYRYFSATVLGWIPVVNAAVSEVPDGRLFASAEEYGNAVAGRLGMNAADKAPAQVLYSLGILFLDPFSSHTQHEAYYNNWTRRLHDFYGSDAAHITEEAERIPSMEAAFSKAVHYLERAANAQSGTDRARSLKALVEAHFFLGRVTGTTDKAAIETYAAEALAIFGEQADYEPERTSIHNILHELNGASKTAPASENKNLNALLATPAEVLLQEYGLKEILQLLTNHLAQTLHGTSTTSSASGEEGNARIPLALRIWEKSASILQVQPDEALLAIHYTQGIQVLAQVYAHPLVFEHNQSPTDSFLHTLEHAAAAEAWSSMQLYASLLAVAAWSSKKSEEGAAIAMLERYAAAFDQEPSLAPFQDFIRWLQGRLHVGEAVNALQQDDLEPAIHHYSEGLRMASDMNHPQQVTNLLGRLDDLAPHATINAAEQLLASITAQAYRLELQITPVGRRHLQSIYRSLLAVFAQHPPLKEIVVLLLLQYAKGFAFGAMLGADDRARVGEATAEATALLSSIKRLTDAGASVVAQSSENGLDEETLLAAYTSSEEKRSGTQPDNVLHNLQITFDALVNKQALTGLRNDAVPLFIPERLHPLIGPRTVVCNFFLGRHSTGVAAIYTVLLTRETMHMSCVGIAGFPSAVIQMEVDGVKANIPATGFLVPETRKKIQDDPAEGSTMSAAADEALKTDAALFLGGDIPGKLEALRAAGKDHLCIIPHGPLHYYPFHLLPYRGGVLADWWKVTSLPNLQMLNRPAKSSADSTQELKELTSLGITYFESNPLGLAPLANAVYEARAVADVFHVEPIEDDAATEAAFYDALMHSRRIHLAAHGQHAASAPAFQRLFLTPSDGHDGVVYAHELLRKDLSHVDLITLSACQTALGRFDESDNILGLPATLLQGGVATIVGTLWPAETHSCQHFFVAFYTALKAGRSKLDAFYTAQQDTRSHYPEARDWGVFYFIGDAN